MQDESGSSIAFELVLDDQGRNVLFVRADRRIGLDDQGLIWEGAQGLRRQPWSAVRIIHLSLQDANKQHQAGICRITFDDGTVLHVRSAPIPSLPDWARVERYSRFVHQLHARIPASQNPHVRFKGGHTRLGFWIASIAIGFMAFWIAIVAPVLFFAEGHIMEGLGFLICGGAGFGLLFWGVWRSRPVEYSPDKIPRHLLP